MFPTESDLLRVEEIANQTYSGREFSAIESCTDMRSQRPETDPKQLVEDSKAVEPARCPPDLSAASATKDGPRRGGAINV
jgi:hypothetical protein